MLKLVDLTREYDADGDAARRVLAADRLNLEVTAGEVFGLVGPNGAGKSTALKMICGLLLPTSGRVLVNVMATMARHGYHPTTVQQARDGCSIEALVPSDLRSFEGSLLVTVSRAAGGTNVEAATTIKGQLFDWGKSRAILDEFFNDLTKQPA